MVSAKRLLNHEVALSDLVLFREMTEEECGNSLPFVLWNALFQELLGGLSVKAARVGAMVAVLLALVFMYRVGHKLAGPVFGLASTAIYASLPSTIFNARNESIFGFSVLLILVVFDAALSFMQRPTWLRSAWLGLVTPLAAYGLANIRLMFFAIPVLFLATAIKDKTFRRACRRLTLALVIVTTLCIPQLLNWSKVVNQVRGRAEHIFGGCFDHLMYLKAEGLGDGRWRGRWFVISRNSRFIVDRMLDLEGETQTRIPMALGILMFVGLASCLIRANSPSRLFLLTVWLGSFVAPAIALWASEVRVMLLGPSEAFMIGLVWADLYNILRSRLRIPALVAGLFIAIPVSVSCAKGAEPMWPFLSSRSWLSELREYLRAEAQGVPVFWATKPGNILNSLRWNPPTFGRDSHAAIPIVGIRRMDIPETIRMIELLDIPAMVVAGGSIGNGTGEDGRWSYSRVDAADVSVMKHAASEKDRGVWITAVDALQLRPDSPVYASELGYEGPNLFIARIDKELLQLRIRAPMDLEHAAVVVRAQARVPTAVRVNLERVATATVNLEPSQGYDEVRLGVAWMYLGVPLSRGDYTLTLNQLDFQQPIYVDDVVLIGTPSGLPPEVGR